ncbi:Ig-like domain-containing protein [Microbacterium sp. ASV49]|uniref:Ig-like domain-containing protein n=1 Tax=Microbacterium candidum TaxID=3041922 RepID=A0ABT7MXH5_9MICO|nr:Ig-like domain-containing protein [Microbacterium sp. ASV49]MDL9979150.1 Ig-like domain-containing protein [Microbacterium sp. ASV49]
MSRRGTIAAFIAGAAVIASVVVVSVVWPGLDAKRTPPAETAVWALQTGSGRHYARVNTAIGELDTVREVANPSAVAQTDDSAFLFSESFGKLTRIDASLPANLDDEALRAAPSTPPGTVEVATAGQWVAYRTDSGTVWAGVLGGAAPVQVGGADAKPLTAAAIALDDSGTLFAYSPSDHVVERYAIGSGQVQGRDRVPLPPASGATLALTATDGVWFLIDSDGRHTWRRGADGPASLALVGDVAPARASSQGEAAWVADDAGLIRLPVDGSKPTRAAGGGTRDLGTPARPVVFDGIVHAAWLGRTSGTLWRSDAGESELSYGSATLDGDRKPVFSASASSLILNETRSGWVWNGRTGALLPSSQDWSLDERRTPQTQQTAEKASVVIDPRPPVAEPDRFGVRAGRLATLPVLLNDHDPNEDVLSIDPASVTGLDPGFGSLTITDNGQRLAVQVAPGAQGTATFHYRVTDGTAQGGGLYSQPTTVTLTVVPDGQDTAPQWCGVPGCLATWPSPEVAPGGTVSVPVLDGWVDPDGDPLLLESVDNPSGAGSVAATPAGQVVYQYPDASQTAPQIVELTVTVADTHGRTSTKQLAVRIAPQPRIAASSFAVTDTQGGGLTIDVAPHVTGTQGRLTLTAVHVLDDARAQAVPTAGATTFDLTADAPGIYRIGYTVSDGITDASATVRVTLLPKGAPAQLATAPVVAFVHPTQDVTVDVLAAVTNPTHRVLLLSDIRTTAEPGASLSVDVVGQRYLRITGTTSTGEPGALGTVRYVVSDGTEDQGARIEGEASVTLLPPAPELAPIAVDDNVVVRAGAQVDIPVLDNDVAAAGGTVTLNPASVHSSTSTALAFAAGRMLRYLAPSTPGEYRVDYSIYAAGNPALADTATVHVTVISDKDNRAPRPRTLEGRVLSGETTTIPFTSFGVDPDGDAVSLDRVLTQPSSGSATLSADGESLVYASVPGFHGQVSFTYQVVDSEGMTGTATARVGVLDAQANPSPVTFTDYVEIQTGATNVARVSPLANDVDPTGGTLHLVAVRPDVPETLIDGSPNPEYAREKALLGTMSRTDIEISAGLSPGTMSFLYDVQSSTGNTARGLIVVKVVRDAVPDYPIVTDTVLTAENRDRFTTGVDVVAGKVSWSGGDVRRLTLSLWGSPDGVTVEGTRLRGPATAPARVIPFALTGTAASGATVTTYGFLRIPGIDDVTLALKPDARFPDVAEKSSVSWDMASLVGIPPGGRLEVGADVAPSGARKGAACVRTGGTTIRYDAGEGAPWQDACIVPVRVVGIGSGHPDWSYLSVPIRIRALAPQPELRAAAVVVGPGETVTYDLKTMTSWQGRTDWEHIAYAVTPPGPSFTVVLKGTVLTVTGSDSAVPGAEDAAVISVTSHPGVAPARLVLRVGAAPSTLPQGGTATARCSEGTGASCTFSVVGATGEVNPLPHTPLQVVSASASASCVGVTFAPASANSIQASWSPDAPGQTCAASFVLRDAQGRVTAGERDGQILLDLQGFPKAPAALTQTAYADGTVTLRVDPGDARLAYPALTGFAIRYLGQVVATCSPSGVCPPISAPNGEERTYAATAVNDVGESRSAVTTTAWAYATPGAPADVTASPVVTSGAGGIVSLTISGIDPSQTGSLQITSPTGDTTQVQVRRSDTAVTVAQYRVGSNSPTPITVTPYSRFGLPPGLGGSPSGASRTVYANGIGAPTSPQLNLSMTSNADDTVDVTASGTAAQGGDGATTQYGIVRDGQTCEVSATGSTAVFRSLPAGSRYTFRLCAESWFQGQMFGRVETTASINAVQTQPPSGYTFQVAPAPQIGQGIAQWLIRDAPTSAQPVPHNSAPDFQGWVAANSPPSPVFDRDPGIQVRFVNSTLGTQTAWVPVTARAGSAPYQVWAKWSVSVCVGGSPLGVSTSSTGASATSSGLAAITVDRTAVAYYDAKGKQLTIPASGDVPVGAVRVAGLAVTVDWTAQNWGLAPAAATFGGTCDPNSGQSPNPNPTP